MVDKPVLLPEWAPVRAVILVWPYPKGDWQANFAQIEECYWGILAALTQEVNVWLLLHHSLDAEVFLHTLTAKSISQINVTLIANADYNDTWVRDYGPLSTSQGYLAYTFNGWGGKYPAQLDNLVAQQLTPYLGGDLQKYSFICEGGGLETNGEILLINADCIVDEKRNPGWTRAKIENFFAQTLGLNSCVWLDNVCLSGDDTDGHIDTIARFTDAQTLVYCGPNATHRDAPILAHLHQQIVAKAALYNWQIYALPTPEYSSLVDGRPLPCTYANFLIVNRCVFVPFYGLPEDNQALAVLQLAFPHHRLIPVACEALLEQHGSLHCATMQIASMPEII
jgi:agmatine/peptidylarginine deiminase